MAEYLCLSDLLDADLSSYEFYCSLPENVKRIIEEEDVRTFEEMQRIANRERNSSSSIINSFF